ncbi:MAG: hypothetical protein ABI675_06355 [Chitinophagaceae bacterium]
MSSFFMRPHPSYPFSEREGTVLNIVIKLHNYHINFISLLSISEILNIIGVIEKPGLCRDGLLFWRRSGGGDSK